MQSQQERDGSRHFVARRRTLRSTVFLSLVCALLVGSAPLQAQEVPGCGTLKNAFGPFDYRDPDVKRVQVPMVEAYHFTPEIEALQRGFTGGGPLPDLTYTLRAIPNHIRALEAIARYALSGRRMSESSIPNADCYFVRAITFRPDDEAVHVVYANYLFKIGDWKKARAQYEEALRLAPDSADINYVAGLFFLATNDLARAKKLAAVAYGKGYPLPGLKRKIEEAEAHAVHRPSR